MGPKNDEAGGVISVNSFETRQTYNSGGCPGNSSGLGVEGVTQTVNVDVPGKHSQYAAAVAGKEGTVVAAVGQGYGNVCSA